MDIAVKEKNGIQYAVVSAEQALIFDVPSALDLMMTVQYQTGCNRIVLNKSAIGEDFFILSTRIAGDVLQKFVNYHIQLAIVGDFSVYTSEPLKDFIYESNRGRHAFFVESEAQATEKLCMSHTGF